MPLPDPLDPATWLWQLIGPDDAITPEWLAALLDTVGTGDEWRSIGVPLQLDAIGNPSALEVHVVLRDEGPVTVWGAALEAARAEEDVDSRWYSFALIADEEAEALPKCTAVGVRAPWP